MKTLICISCAYLYQLCLTGEQKHVAKRHYSDTYCRYRGIYFILSPDNIFLSA